MLSTVVMNSTATVGDAIGERWAILILRNLTLNTSAGNTRRVRPVSNTC